MGKFTIKSTSAGFSFNFVADNNEIIATSEVYTTKEACKKGIGYSHRVLENPEDSHRKA
jgi:uncharacterized protein YegP (UPF0339 family)